MRTKVGAMAAITSLLVGSYLILTAIYYGWRASAATIGDVIDYYEMRSIVCWFTGTLLIVLPTVALIFKRR